MIGLPDLLAIGLAGFMAGMAYAHRGYLAAMKDAARARALVVEGRAFILVPLMPDPGFRQTFSITVPADPKGDRVALSGGKSEDEA